MLYLHIPFCKQKCSYCNFHFSTNFSLKNEMVDAICREIDLRHNELSDKQLQSIYFGGGTPSVLDYGDLAKIFERISRYFSWNRDTEITLEANPDDLNAEFLKNLNKIGINRLSIGIQSFFDEDLKLMNRAHNASQAECSVMRSQDSGISNISIDLIYGSPTSDFSVWKENLNKAVSLEVPHISSYSLTVEPKTALQSWIESDKISAPDEALQSAEFQYMSDFLKEKGFDHYEISNFGKPDFHSKHNSAYWQGKPYLGIGPSAHSYDGANRRSWNIANNSLYIKNLNQNKSITQSEILTQNEQFNEFIMIGLRTSRGVDLSELKSRFSDEVLQKFDLFLNEKLARNQVIAENNFLKIPYEKWFMVDGIASDFFLI